MLLAAIVSAALLPASGWCNLVWSESFDGANVGDTLNDLGAPWGGAGGQYEVATNGPFGSGNHLKLNENANGAWVFVNNDQSTVGLATLAFDVYDDSTLNFDGYVRVAMSCAAPPNNAALIDVGPAAVASNEIGIGQDQAYHIDIVANTTAAAITASNGTTIPAGTVVSFLDGVQVHSIAAAQGGVACTSGVDGFGVWMNSNGTNNGSMFLMDDFEFHDMAVVVPEPASFALLALAGFFLIRNARKS